MTTTTQTELIKASGRRKYKLPRDVEYRHLSTETDVIGAIVALAEYPVIGVDIETTALNPADGRIRSIQLAVSGDRAVVIDCDAVPIATFAHNLSRLLEGRKKIAHNAAFEAMWFEANGIRFRRPLFDTMIASQLLTCGHKHPANLKACVERYSQST